MHSRWVASSHGSGARHWGVSRFNGKEWLRDRRGRIRWFASHEAAAKRAQKLNNAEYAALLKAEIARHVL